MLRAVVRVVGNRELPLTPADVAKRLGVSEVSVRRWVLEGKLEGVRLGDGQLARYRVSEDALDRFVRPAAPPTAGAS
jgi:excisionase family DNA binding protein